MLDIDGIISASQKLKALPESATRLATILRDPEWELEQIVHVVERDPLLTSRLLARANSSSVGGQVPTSSVDQAMMRIGPGVVLSIAVGAAAKAELGKSLKAYELEAGALWRHAVACALTIELLPTFGVKISPETYTAALLHDIGKIVLVKFLGKSDLEFTRRAQVEGGQSFVDAEFEIYELHHGEIGGLVANHWNLPESVIAGIRFHHDPSEAPEEFRSLCEQVALADQVARTVSAGDGESEHLGLEELGERLGLAAEQTEELKNRVEEALAEELETYG